MRKGETVAAVAALLATTLGGAARAQDGPAGAALGQGVPVFTLPPLDAERLAEDGLALGARARVLYDSNQLRLGDGVVAPPGLSRDDVITTIVGVARARVSPGLQVFYVDAEIGRDYRRENDFLSRSRVGVDGGWNWRLGTRCAGQVAGAYSRAQADIAEQGAILANLRDLVSVRAGGGCEIGLGLRPTLDYNRRESENSSGFRRAADFTAEAFRAGLSYNRTGRTGVALGFRDERFLYPNRLDPETGRPIEVDRTAAGARLEARIADRTDVAVFADHNWLEPRGRPVRFRELTGGVTAVHRPIPRFAATAAMLREVDAAFFVAAGYVRRDRVELGGRYSISPRTRIALRAGVERNRYRDRRATAGVDLRSFDRLLTLEAIADYRIARGIHAQVDVRRDDRATDGALGAFTGTRVGASLRVTI